MWYYDSYLESSDISVTLMHNGGGGYSSGDVGILSEMPSFSVNHEWKDSHGSVKESVTTGASQIWRGAKKGIRQIFGDNLIDAITNANSSLYDEKIQPNTNLLKEFDGSSISFNIPNFIMLFLCDSDGVDTRKLTTDFIKKHKLFGEEDIREDYFVQSAPGGFHYTKDYSEDFKVIGSFSLNSPKFTIRNLLPTQVSITASDNLIKGVNCPLFIKVEISWTFGRLMQSKQLIQFIENSGG